MKTMIFFYLLIYSLPSFAQSLINVVFVDDNGITDNVKKAKYFIAIKSFGDSVFERLEYNLTGPRRRSIKYNSSNMQVRQGEYLEYGENGYIHLKGQYTNNKKTGDWYIYNDTMKAILKTIYENDILIRSINIDTTEKKTTDSLKKGEREAVFKGKKGAYKKFLTANLRYPETAQAIGAKGMVMVQFIINTEGSPGQAQVRKSVEFSLDQEALRIISIMPKWDPAMQDGKYVNAYRIQPVTFSPPE